MTKSNGNPESRRKHPRIVKPIRVEHMSGDSYFYDYSHDVSEGGIFILTDHPLKAGTVIDLKLCLPEGDRSVQVRGEVVWVYQKKNLKPIDNEEEMGRIFESLLKQAQPAVLDVKPQGMGIRFIELTDEQKAFLRNLLDR